jgi:sortase A
MLLLAVNLVHAGVAMTVQRDPEYSFRRVALSALVALWLGLTLLAVGLVFSLSSRRADLVLSALEGPGGSRPSLQLAATSTQPTPVSPCELPPYLTPTPEVATATPSPIPEAPAPAGPPTRLVIPSISVDVPVVPVGWHEELVNGVRLMVWDVADYAAGWHKTSGVPGGGTNIVISGHHNIRGSVFRDLATLQGGDVVILYAGEKAFKYVVNAVFIFPEKGMPLEVRQENARWIAPTEREQLTLVTCWPHDNNTHRVIVVAYPAG